MPSVSEAKISLVVRCKSVDCPCTDPQYPIIAMDEPTASLDQRTAHDIESAILNLQDCLIISVTTAIKEIMELYDDIIVLKDGQIEETGPSRTPRCQRLLLFPLHLTK